MWHDKEVGTDNAQRISGAYVNNSLVVRHHIVIVVFIQCEQISSTSREEMAIGRFVGLKN